MKKVECCPLLRQNNRAPKWRYLCNYKKDTIQKIWILGERFRESINTNTNPCSCHNGDPIVLHQWTHKPSTWTPSSFIHQNWLISDLFFCCPNYSMQFKYPLRSNSSCSFISLDIPRIGILIIRSFDGHDFAIRIFFITPSKVECLTNPFKLDFKVAWSCHQALVLYFANDNCFEPGVWSFICSWSTVKTLQWHWT